MAQPTLKTIADEMNLSVSAVSRIINGKGKSIGLSDHTIESTLLLAKRIGYRPHLQAQSLRLGKTSTIGVILCLPEPNNSDLVYRLFKGIAGAARKAKQTMLFFDIDDTASALAAIEQCINARVDGIIATDRKDTVYINSLQNMIHQGGQVVTVLNAPGIQPLECPAVVVDHELGGYLATEHLIKKGYRRIAHLANPCPGSVGGEHLAGYRRALASSDLVYEPALVINDTEINNFSGAVKLLELRELPDAVFCWNDRSAAAASRIFKQAEQDIAIIGFDNREFIQYLAKPFDSVDYPLLEVGEKAVETLLSGDMTRRRLTINPKLVKYQHA